MFKPGIQHKVEFFVKFVVLCNTSLHEKSIYQRRRTFFKRALVKWNDHCCKRYIYCIPGLRMSGLLISALSMQNCLSSLCLSYFWLSESQIAPSYSKNCFKTLPNRNCYGMSETLLSHTVYRWKLCARRQSGLSKNVHCKISVHNCMHM